MSTTRRFTNCPRCGCALVKSVAINGLPSEYWYECSECNTYVNSYVPQEHQDAVHRDPHKHKGNFGGYGTGKTTTSREQVYKHMLITPNGNTLIGTKVSYQYEQTIKRDIEADLPAAFIANQSVQKQYYDLQNGHRLMFRPFEDAGKIRSYNLTMYVIVEASEVDYSIYTQLKTRLRNMNATKPHRDKQGNIVYKTIKGVPVPVVDADWREGIIESNPDAGWVRTEVLNVSEEVNKYGNVTDTFNIIATTADKFTSSHVAATDVNAYLPENFIEENSKNKPIWWINRFLYGSFNYAEGLVYPNARGCIVDPFEIPKNWKRIIAFDYGLTDAACYVFGAIDPQKSMIYIYKETRDYNRNVKELADVYKRETTDIPNGGLVCPPLIDPKSAPKRDYNKKSLADYFLEEGILFEPGFVGIDARVFRLNTYIESGRLKIFSSCEYLIAELSDYKFPSKELGKTVANANKPIDKNNHAINPLEWITMKLPADPAKLLHGVYNNMGIEVNENTPVLTYDSYVFNEGEFNEEGDNIWAIS